jgi:DegV family protein with EDD domain
VGKIKIITDSTCDLPDYIITEYDIEVMPLIINIGEKSFIDREEISLDKLYEVMNEENVFPTTAQVNPQRFATCYKKYLDEGYNIISIHMSSKMSGTYQSACIAKDMLDNNNIVTIDSLNVTSGLGLLVLKAAKLVKEGKNINEIETIILEMVPHVKSILIFESLENLVKGGRLSKTAGVIGGVLGIRPILAINNGEMEVLNKVRGSKKAIKLLTEHIENAALKPNETAFLLHAHNEEILPFLREFLHDIKLDFVEGCVGCTVGCHSGFGAYGVFYIEEY